MYICIDLFPWIQSHLLRLGHRAATASRPSGYRGHHGGHDGGREELPQALADALNGWVG